jgi:hypothetical protein
MTEIRPPYDGRRNITKGQKAMGQPRPDLGRQYGGDSGRAESQLSSAL